MYSILCDWCNIIYVTCVSSCGVLCVGEFSVSVELCVNDS